MNYTSAFVKEIPTKFMFNMVSSVIYNGDFDSSSVKPTRHEVLDMWNFADGGEYFVPENTWSYPDEL